MIIDAHAHVYPDPIARRASDAIAAFYGMPVRFDGRVETLIRLGDAGGIGRFLICSVATVPSAVRSVNQFIEATAAAHPGRFIPLAALHPDSPDIRGDVERAIDAGMMGVKIHPDFQRFSLSEPRIIEMMSHVAGRLPALIHSGDARYDFSHPWQLAHLARALPDLRIIAAHLGGWSEWDEAAAALAPCTNVIVDTSSSLYELAPERAVRLIRAFGADRVMFGSDYPMWSPAEEVERVRALGLSPGEERSVLFGTAARFFGISNA